MIRPLNNYVLLQPIKEKQETDFGLILSSDEKTKKEFGIVISVGDGIVDIAPNQKVFFDKWSSEEVEMGGEKYLLVSADKILAIIED